MWAAILRLLPWSRVAGWIGAYRWPLLAAGAAAALGASYAAGWRMGGDSVRADLYRQVEESLRIQAEAYAREIRARDAALQKRDQARRQLEIAAQAWRQRYEASLRQSEAMRRWARERHPRAVADRLRELSAAISTHPRDSP